MRLLQVPIAAEPRLRVLIQARQEAKLPVAAGAEVWMVVIDVRRVLVALETLKGEIVYRVEIRA